MEYKSLSKIILSGVIFLFAIFLGLFLFLGGNWYIGIIPLGIALIGILVYKAPIDRIGFKNQDVRIDDQLMNAAITEYPIISSYSEPQKKLFNRRMFHFLFDRESYLVSGETEKLDIYHTLLMSVPAIIMYMAQEDDPFADIERLVAYKHAFPSPKMQFIHSAEYDEEDGVIILSIEQMMQSLRVPAQYYHIVFHVWAERHIRFNENFAPVPKDFLGNILSIFGFSMESIENLLGYKNPDLKAVAIVAFFTRNRQLHTIDPQWHAVISREFGYENS